MLAGSLAAPHLAHAEQVSSATSGALAIAPDGTPRVAALHGGTLAIATRGAAGWTESRVTDLPSPTASIAGIVVDSRGLVSVLAEDVGGTWLTLLRGRPGGTWSRWAIVPLGRAAGVLGPAGLALDAHGSPVVAYGFMRGAYEPRLGGIPTYVRLARLAGGRIHTAPITKLGFPPSDRPPAATPVLVGKAIHVVETYTSAAIEWIPKRPRGWTGQYLFASELGAPVGPIGAVATTGGIWSAWTQDDSEVGEIRVVLNVHRRSPPRTIELLAHGQLVSLALRGGSPEIGANDWVDLGAYRDYAAVVATTGGAAVQLDGRLETLAASARGGEQVLLQGAEGLEWYTLPTHATRVSLTADPDGKVHGRVDGVAGGSVELYREQEASQRTRIATVALGPDGAFFAQDSAPILPTLYRAVYRDPSSGVPYAAFTRAPVG
jgi:hypothetical protein